jgi:hypothetical protein
MANKKAKAAYQKAKAAGKSFLSKATWSKAVKTNQNDWATTIATSLVDLGAGFAGATGGSFLGWAALPVGFAGNVVANKTGHSWARAMSIGMMTAPVDEAVGASSRTANTGFDLKTEISNGSERSKNYLSQVYRKFGLHKIFGNSASSASTDSPDTSESVNGLGNASFDALDKYEQQILSSGIEHEGGAAPSGQRAASADALQQTALEAFSVNGLDDLDTPHII